MARVLLYERIVDACAHILTSCDMGIQYEDGMKIKEEPVDTTLDIDATDTLVTNLSNLKNNTLSRNCSNMINNEESLLENDVSSKIVNNKKNKRISNSHSAYVDDADKNFNLKRKGAIVKEQMCDSLSQSNKKQKRSNNFQSSKNENINTFTETTEKFAEKIKQQSITADSRTKKQRITRSSKKDFSNECDICFRQFSSSRNCDSHKQYYIKIYKRKNCFTRRDLYLHTMKCSNATFNTNNYIMYCNFCTQTFRRKAFLQSHLFHLHSKLIYSSNIIKQKNPKSKNGNVFCKNDTLKIDAHEKLPCLSNVLKSEKRNITLINNNKSRSDGNATKSENFRIEESSSNEMSPTKKLRQPTLMEYLELCKRKHDINASPNKFNVMKDNFREKTKNFSEMYNAQVDSLSAKSSNLGQTTYSTLEQNRNQEVFKKPFVKLHADVEMMKSFLEKLPNTIIGDKTIKDQQNNIISHYHEIPYSLRSLRTISSMETTTSNSRKRKSEDAFKSQFNTECNTGMEHNMINSDKIDSTFWKTIMVRFKCKDCKIVLTRCDKKIRNCQIPTIEAMSKNNISFSPQCNSMSFHEDDMQNKMVMKKLEIPLERLKTVPVIDITKTNTMSDIEKHNDDSFLCKVCKKSFSSKLDKHMHIKSSHIAYMSSICDARYKLKHKLLQHYLSEHRSKQNQCCVCYTLLSNYIELKRHLSIHCLKYVQRENDHCPIDVEIKCSLIKNNYKCLNCGTAFLSQTSLMIHQSFCILQEEMTEDQKDSMKEINGSPKIILKMQRSNNDNGLMIIHDEKTHSDECSSKNSIEMTNKHHIPLINEEDSEIIEEDPEINKDPKINEDKQNSSVNNNLVTKEIGIINESQNSEKGIVILGNNNSTITNQDMNAQLDTIKSKINIYPCDTCGKQFHTQKNLQQHIRTFTNTTDICPICGTAFSSKRLLQSHITAAHVPQISKTYNFHCVFCNQGFIKKYELRPHILHLHGQQILDTLIHDSCTGQEKSSTQNAICNICNLVFDKHDRYMEHRMYYYKNHTFTCSLCAQNFQGMYMLHHHNKLTHYSEDKRKSYNYICDICNEGFTLESHFHSHNMHIHSNEENLIEIAKDSEERSRFDHTSEVQEQIANCSTNQQKEIEQSNEYTCQICQLKCIDINDLAKHITFYSNDGDFKCDRCKRQYATRDLLYQHRKLTHICRDIYNGHACHVCGEVLETVISLECHMKHFHSNDIVCDDADDHKNCEQTLSSNTANKVTKHETDKQLESNDTLESNDNTVKGRYTCSFCNMKFFSAKTIQTHIIQTHIDDLFPKRTTLRPTLSTIEDDNIQKQSVQQLVEADQASTSLITLTPLISAVIGTIRLPENGTIRLTETATTTSTVTVATTSTSATAAATTTSTVTVATTSTSATAVAATFEDNSTQFLQDKIPNNNILDKNGVKNKTNIEPSQIKTIFPEDNTISANGYRMPSVNEYKTNITPSMAIALSNQFNANNPDNNKTAVSRSFNEFLTNLISLSNKTDKFRVSVIQSTTNSSKSVIILPQAKKSNEITSQKSEPMNNCNSNYMCPLCPVEYPSLMFFHAHLRYAHADSIQTDTINPSINDISQIKCLLCLCMFTDENTYKNHLKNSHSHIYISKSKNVEKTDDKKKNITPEIITVDDDDDDNIETNQSTAEVTTIFEKQNEKIGKLRVKSFAKIVENLSIEYAKNLQSKQVSHFS